MSLEPGGIADKEGNRYENDYLTYLIVQLLNGEIKGLHVEPTGEEGIGVELYIIDNDNNKHYYQCKMSNGDKSYWSINDLKNRGVLRAIDDHLKINPDAYFTFVTPLHCTEFNDLCTHAHSCEDVEDFLNNKIQNGPMKNALDTCCAVWAIDVENEADKQLLYRYLTHSKIEIIDEKFGTLDDIIFAYFTGNKQTNRETIGSIVSRNRWYSKTLTASDFEKELARREIYKKIFEFSKTTEQVIETINESYWEDKKYINNLFYETQVYKDVISCIENNVSVVLSGAAGTGKSCHLDSISKYLKENEINYLRIKLDKRYPEFSSKYFGESLNLPGSPVDSIYSVSGNKKCVLILDQLDALRWSGMHSSTALDVCREMISEIRSYNTFKNANIVLIITCRTVDLNNDS